MSSDLSAGSKKVVSTPRTPLPWEKADVQRLKRIQGVCLDIDDTLSTGGKLTSEAYQSLWNLKKAGFAVVPITGRPAGWCDHFARFWPVDAIVGENGAFSFFMDGGIRKRINTPAGAEDSVLKHKLTQLGEAIRKKFPQARWASDQSYREYDLAIDVCEDVPAWSSSDVQALLDLCIQEGAHAKLSSIHVNTWFGDYDKKRGFEHWLSQGAPGYGRVLAQDQWLYIGDSPNDEPMFAAFECSVGVANLNQYLAQLKNPPTWMTSAKSGEGFTQMANRLIEIRNEK